LSFRICAARVISCPWAESRGCKVVIVGGRTCPPKVSMLKV
jgi:hypothetical protein